MEKEHLYGSDLKEALIGVAHLFLSSNARNVGVSQQCTVGKYINCLVQISKILYSRDCHRTPKQCYNSTIVLSLCTNYIVTFLEKQRLVCTFMLCLVMVLLSMKLSFVQVY